MRRLRGSVSLFAAILGIATASAGRAAGSATACHLLTPTQISAAVGSSVDDGTPVPAVRDACVWREVGKPPGAAQPMAQVQVLNAQDYDRIKTFRAAISTTESGIGDEAHYFRDGITGGFQLIVRAGGKFFSIVSWPPHPGSQQSDADDARAKAVEQALALALPGVR